MRTARVLCIDGGGIRGMIPAAVLAQLERAVGPVSSRFHMVAGTSTGGILACALARPPVPVPASELIRFYHQRGPEIFPSSFLGAAAGVAGPLYDAAPLEKALVDVLGNRWLSEVNVDLLATSYDMENRKPEILKSWKAKGGHASDYLLRSAARATSAAPTFLPPAIVADRTGRTHALVDGGVYANDPAMCAWVAARRLYPLADRYVVVSVGTGRTIRKYPREDVESWGLAGWAQPLLDIMFDGSTATTEYELDQLAPEVKQYRIQIDLSAAGASESMDDTSSENLDKLEKAGRAAASGPVWDSIVKELSSPMTDRLSMGWSVEKENVAPPVFVKPTGLAKVPAVVEAMPVQRKVSYLGAAAGALAGTLTLGPAGLLAAIPGWFGGSKLGEKVDG